MILLLLKKAKQSVVKVGICGQGPSDFWDPDAEYRGILFINVSFGFDQAGTALGLCRYGF
jgi:hypothetical protein